MKRFCAYVLATAALFAALPVSAKTICLSDSGRVYAVPNRHRVECRAGDESFGLVPRPPLGEVRIEYRLLEVQANWPLQYMLACNEGEVASFPGIYERIPGDFRPEVSFAPDHAALGEVDPAAFGHRLFVADVFAPTSGSVRVAYRCTTYW